MALASLRGIFPPSPSSDMLHITVLITEADS